MYELADWGSPVAATEIAQRDRLTMHLPHSVVRILRSRARAQGVSLETLVGRMLQEALDLPGHRQHPRVMAPVD